MKEISPPPLKEVSPWRIQRYSEADDAEFAYGGAPGNPHLRDYWNILVKRRLLIAQVTFALIVTGAYFNLPLPLSTKRQPR